MNEYFRRGALRSSPGNRLCEELRGLAGERGETSLRLLGVARDPAPGEESAQVEGDDSVGTRGGPLILGAIARHK
jgi:hypothetical protein